MADDAEESSERNAYYRDQFVALGAMCINLYLQTKDDREWSAELNEAVDKLTAALREIWGALTEIYAQRAPAWRVDPDAPGYLVRTTADGELHLPYQEAPIGDWVPRELLEPRAVAS